MEITEIPKIVTGNISYTDIETSILETSIVAWENHVTKKTLDDWLSNFDGRIFHNVEAERALAAWLLLNFTYYNNEEIMELCRIIFRKYIHVQLEKPEYSDTSRSTNDKIKSIVSDTAFIYLGNPSESSSKLLFDFRTANNLNRDAFPNDSTLQEKINNGQVKNIVIIDDVTLSGSQAIKYFKENKTYSMLNMFFLVFFASEHAITGVKNALPMLTILYSSKLDERARLFGNDSFVFSSSACAVLKESAFLLCTQYGKIIVENELPPCEAYMKNYPLGFDDGQYTFAFSYNTPDNTLPIFWCKSSNWKPIFIRHPKIYNIGGVDFPNEHYW